MGTHPGLGSWVDPFSRSSSIAQPLHNQSLSTLVPCLFLATVHALLAPSFLSRFLVVLADRAGSTTFALS